MWNSSTSLSHCVARISGSLRLVERGHDLKEVTEVIADLRRRHKKASRLGNKNLQNWKELEGEAGKPEWSWIIQHHQVKWCKMRGHFSPPNIGFLPGVTMVSRWCLCWVMPLHNSDMTIWSMRVLPTNGLTRSCALDTEEMTEDDGIGIYGAVSDPRMGVLYFSSMCLYFPTIYWANPMT